MFNFLLCAFATIPVSTQEEPPKSIAAIRFGGLEAMLPDAKDAGLLRLLRRLDDRLIELPGEFGASNVLADLIETLAEILAYPLRLEVAVASQELEGMPIPLIGILESEVGAETGLGQRLFQALRSNGVSFASESAGGLVRMEAPFPAWIGAKDEAVSMRFGSASGMPTPPTGAQLPGEWFRASFDTGQFLDAFSQAPFDEAQEFGALLGLLETESLRSRWSAGFDDQSQVFHQSTEGLGAIARDAGIRVDSPLGLDFLRAAPADATWGFFTRWNPRVFMSAVRDSISKSLGAAGSDPLAEVEELLGVSIDEDLLAPLGERFGVYAADSIGGEGLLSTIFVLELANPDGFADTMDLLDERAESVGEMVAAGRVRLEARANRDRQAWTLSFPGLPAPIELTVISTGTQAVVGLTIQGALAAAKHLESPGETLLDHPLFLAQLPEEGERCFGLEWMDTPRLMRSGYMLLAGACAAGANGVRSPADSTREVGIVIPAYAELLEGALPLVSVHYGSGEGVLHTRSNADRSQLVNAAGLIGWYVESPLMPIVATGLLATLIVPQVAQNLHSAEDAKVKADIAAILAAVDQYAIENGGEYPGSLEELIRPADGGLSYLKARRVPRDPWGEPYRYEPPTADNPRPRVYSVTHDG